MYDEIAIKQSVFAMMKVKIILQFTMVLTCPWNYEFSGWLHKK